METPEKSTIPTQESSSSSRPQILKLGNKFMTLTIFTDYEKNLRIRLPRSNENVEMARTIMRKNYDVFEIKAEGGRCIYLNPEDIIYTEVRL